jgi:hypothetical protein
MRIGTIVEYAEDQKHLRVKPNRQGKLVSVFAGGTLAIVHWDGNKNPSSSINTKYLKESSQ